MQQRTRLGCGIPPPISPRQALRQELAAAHSKKQYLIKIHIQEWYCIGASGITPDTKQAARRQTMQFTLVNIDAHLMQGDRRAMARGVARSSSAQAFDLAKQSRGMGQSCPMHPLVATCRSRRIRMAEARGGDCAYASSQQTFARAAARSRPSRAARRAAQGGG